MSHYFINDECDECINYVRMISDPNSWKCILCGIHEMEIYLGDKHIIWDRFMLACNHEVHMRCYRKWCKQNNTVGCSECGNHTKTEENMYCEECDVFGHSKCSFTR
jgi:hypothetical protein